MYYNLKELVEKYISKRSNYISLGYKIDTIRNLLTYNPKLPYSLLLISEGDYEDIENLELYISNSV